MGPQSVFGPRMECDAADVPWYQSENPSPSPPSSSSHRGQVMVEKYFCLDQNWCILTLPVPHMQTKERGVYFRRLLYKRHLLGPVETRNDGELYARVV